MWHFRLRGPNPPLEDDIESVASVGEFHASPQSKGLGAILITHSRVWTPAIMHHCPYPHLRHSPVMNRECQMNNWVTKVRKSLIIIFHIFLIPQIEVPLIFLQRQSYFDEVLVGSLYLFESDNLPPFFSFVKSCFVLVTGLNLDFALSVPKWSKFSHFSAYTR